MRIVLFTGEGGTATTTLAAATAAHVARSRKTLVLTLDHAHALGHALGTRPGSGSGEAVEVDGVPGLFAAHLDAAGLLAGAWPALREHLPRLGAADADELVAEELTVLPGVEELLALREVRRAAEGGPWDVVVVDAGPAAAALRLLALPEAVARYVERLFPAHRRAVRSVLGGLLPTAAAASADRVAAARRDRTAEALEELAGELAGLCALLDPSRTGVRLAVTPERGAVADARRTLTALALHGLRVDGVVVDRLVPGPPPGETGVAAAWLRERAGAQRAALAALPADVPVHAARDVAAPSGPDALRALAADLWGDDDPVADGAAPAAPLLAVRRTAGTGTSPESEFELALHLPGVGTQALDLARIGDELAVTAAGVRRVVALPAALRRCTVVRARLEGDDLRVVFRPDPALWMH